MIVELKKNSVSVSFIAKILLLLYLLQMKSLENVWKWIKTEYSAIPAGNAKEVNFRAIQKSNLRSSNVESAESRVTNWKNESDSDIKLLFISFCVYPLRQSEI